jgi:Phosphopantetheinyl transferase
MEYRKKKENSEQKLKFEDNTLGWHDAISDKLDKMRKYGQGFHISRRDDGIIGIMPIVTDSDTLLSYLEKKDIYQLYLNKMSENRKREWLSVRVLLKEILGEEKTIGYLPSGKPYLTDGSWKISISHTKGYAAVILDKKNEVSIDIEQISSRVNKIQDRFMNEKEKQNLSLEKELIHILLHWSAKESMYKILDDEKIEFKTQLLLNPFEPKTNEWSKFKAKAKESEFTVHYFVSDDYVLTYISTLDSR